MSKVIATLTGKRKAAYNEKHGEDEGFTPLEGGDEQIEVEYNFGENVDEAVSLFGDEVVKSNADAQITVTLQENIRRWKEAGLSTDSIQAKADAWKPGVITRIPGQSFKDKVAKKFATMSPEEQESFMQLLMDASEGVQEEA